jgi:predicted ATPase
VGITVVFLLAASSRPKNENATLLKKQAVAVRGLSLRRTEMQFAHIRLSNWRNFKSVDVRLSQRVFLIGPNASGKSNLLDAFRFLRDTAKAGFEKAVTDRGGVSGLRCLAATGRYSDIVIDVKVESGADSDDSLTWQYRLEFNQDNQRKPIVKREDIWRNGISILSRPDEDDEKDQPRLRQTHLEQVNANQEFRELPRFFESVNYLHLVPHIIRDSERYVGRSGDPFGSDFLERLALAPENIRRARLRRILEALKVAVPQLNALELDRDNRGTPHLKARYDHWRPQGAWQNEKLFSDGTLRFFGFLWSLLDGQGPLLLEEPELSLHPGIVRRLARVIYRLQKEKGRQVLISTHSRDLVSDKGIGAEEVLLLRPAKNGTTVLVGKDDIQIRTLLEAGESIAEAALPTTEPKNAMQLELQFLDGKNNG